MVYCRATPFVLDGVRRYEKEQKCTRQRAVLVLLEQGINASLRESDEVPLLRAMPGQMEVLIARGEVAAAAIIDIQKSLDTIARAQASLIELVLDGLNASKLK